MTFPQSSANQTAAPYNRAFPSGRGVRPEALVAAGVA